MGRTRSLVSFAFIGFMIIGAISMIPGLRIPSATAASGVYYDHIVIIAMENQNFGSVIGSSSAPFINSMVPYGTVIPYYHSYGATSSISGCSAACYVAFMGGSTYGTSDGYGGGSVNAPNLVVDRLVPAGLSWKAFCESGCPRGPDHFPFLGFADTVNSPNIFTSSSVSTSDFIAAANSADPPNFLWYTPTDGHNMHDNSVSSGDAYLQSFLIGSGTFSNPAQGSLLASNVFKMRTELYIWWDEYDPSPNLQIGFGAAPIKAGYSSSSNGYDEYASLHTIESNWALSPLSNDAQAPVMNDIFGAVGPLPLVTSFTFTPPTPTVGQTITFTAAATGGTSLYTFSWNFGDGSVGTGASATHSYRTAGSYTVTERVTDSASPAQTANSSLQVIVLTVLPLATSFSVSPSIPTVNTLATFTATTTGGAPPYTISWNFGDGLSATGTTVSHTYTTAQPFTVTETANDSSSPQQSVTRSQTITVNSALSGNFGTCTSLPQGWNCGNATPSTSSATIVNGVLETRQSNPGQGSDNNYYFATTQKGTFPWSPCQASATGVIPSDLTSVSSTFTLLTYDPGSSPSSDRYHIYIALYYWLPNGPLTAGGSTYQCLDTQVRVESIGGVFSPVASTATYNPGDSFGWDQVTLPNINTGQTYTLTADVAQQCHQDLAAWGLPTATPCQLTGIEIGTEGFQFQELDVNWSTVTLTTNQPSTLTAALSFTPNTPFTGQAVSFTSAATGGTAPYTYSWSFGDGTTSTAQNPSYTYTATGSYTVTLNIRDSTSPQQTASASQTITVAAPPPALSASFTLTPSSPQVGQSLTFTAMTTGGSQPYTYTWSFGDGATGSGASVTHSYSTAQSYTVNLNVVDNAGSRVSSSQTVTVAPVPPSPLQASFTVSPTTIQTEQTVTFTGTTSGGTQPYTYSWTFGDGATGTGAVATHAYSAPGTYTVTLTVADSASQTASSSNSVNIVQAPIPDFSVNANPTTLSVQAGGSVASQVQLLSLNSFSGSVTLTATVSPSGPSTSFTSTTVTLAPAGSGSSTLTLQTSPTTFIGRYSVTVNAVDGSITHTVQISLTVSSVPPPPDFVLSVSQSTLTIQAGHTKQSVATLSSTNGFSGVLQVTATSSPGLNFTLSTGTIILTSGSSQTLTITIGVFSTTTPGTYNVTFTAANGSLQHSTIITVKSTRGNRLHIIVPGPKTVVAGSTIQFTVNATDLNLGSTVTLSASGLPYGASFNPVTGLFAWTPLVGQVGTYNITFGATDNGAPIASDSNYVIVNVQGTPSNQGQGTCTLCQIVQTASTNTWLLFTGALAGFLATLSVIYARARAQLSHVRRLRKIALYKR